jgi:glycosyltransferase involved in cell wall biosynthesis
MSEGVIKNSDVGSVQVGVALLTKNGGRWLPALLNSLRQQSETTSLRIAAIDSGSSDETLEILKNYGLDVKQIAPESFSHSRTRNEATRLLGDVQYILFVSQDALPLEADWLALMRDILASNQGIDAVSACEVTSANDLFAVGGVGSQWLKCKQIKIDIPIDPTFLERLPLVAPEKRRSLFPFTNVCALYRSSALNDYAFDESWESSEDIAWVIHALQRGRSVLFTSRVTVLHQGFHSNREYRAKRGQQQRASARLFGAPFESTFRRIVKALLSVFRELARELGA